MRRGLQEIKDAGELRAILDSAQYASLGLTDSKVPYVVPLNFGYEWGKQPVFYFHGATQGRKMDMIRANPNAAALFVGGAKLLPGDAPCSNSFEFESVLAEGKIDIIVDPDAKRKALEAIVKRYTQMKGEFKPEYFARVAVFRLVADVVRGKSNG
jgi:nitroimidazol reductase NimA-like FMN-containing flavoprotein (pyridoxamine 5'-phosphate oxidase superfamily)